jgi:hypothetical protein
MIIRAEIAEVSVSSPITGSLCNTLWEQSVSGEQPVPSATLVSPPYPKEKFYDYPDRGIDVLPPPIRGEPPCCQRGRNFTTILIHGIDALPPLIRGGPSVVGEGGILRLS